MQDPFSGRHTCLQGSIILSPREQAAVLDGHRQRLWALDQLVEAAAQCGIQADKDRDFLLLAEDEMSLFEGVGQEWAALYAAIRAFRMMLPIITLEVFGFYSEAADPFEDNALQLRRIGGGVEALAFVDS